MDPHQLVEAYERICSTLREEFKKAGGDFDALRQTKLQSFLVSCAVNKIQIIPTYLGTQEKSE